ncbi:MAG TPA: hypothetical protein ENJ18_11645 [Nannocystis exedens]|nr:hypothetical protein [Nannocystis exedens]
MQHEARSERVHDRQLAAIAMIGLFLFVAAFTVAAWLYPGGTWANRAHVGHSFFGNFLCDLMQPRALNGEPAELSSLFARFGILALSVAHASFYIQVARLDDPTSGRARLTRRAGLLACAISLAIPLVTADALHTLHVIIVVAAFVPALLATSAAFLICMRSPASTPTIRFLAALTLGVAGFNFLLYAFLYVAYWLGVQLPRPHLLFLQDLLPQSQRIAIIGLVLWILVLSLRRKRA